MLDETTNLKSMLTRPDLVCEDAFLAGKWVSAASGKTFAVTNPARGDVIANVPDLSRTEVADAIAAAKVAQKVCAARAAKERAHVLRKWFDLMMENQEDLAIIMTAEQGKPLAEARGEVAYGASFVEWFAEEAKRIYGETIPGHMADKRITVIKQPIGVAAGITPWNFPNAMIARKVAPAFAAGCAFVIKPSELTPLSALAMAKLAEAGIPAMTSRGKTGHQVTAGWLLHLAPLGGKIFDDQWNPVINSPEGVEAAQVMREIAQTGPKGIPTFGFGEASASFLQGESAMYLDTLKIAAMSRDPKLSKVDGKVGFALHPTGSRCGSETGGFAAGIPANSQNKEAAFLFAMWMNSEEISLQRVQLPYALRDPFRPNHFASEEYRSRWPSAGEYLDILEQGANSGMLDLSLIQIDRYNEALRQGFSRLWSGEDPQEVLDKVAADWDALTDRIGVEKQRRVYTDWASKPNAYPN